MNFVRYDLSTNSRTAVIIEMVARKLDRSSGLTDLLVSFNLMECNETMN